MTTNTTQLTVVQFRKHKVAYTVAAVVALAGMFYFIFKDDGSVSLTWFFLAAGTLLSAYCTWNVFSNAVVLELNPNGIKYKRYFYSWNRLLSYAIREEEDEGGSFNYLVLNLKNAKVPLEIQLDWINDQKSVIDNMAIFTKAFQIEFEGC
ncbi:hypothetical protein [Pedobacter hiemivivus]|uniref:Uncharacterized protein n=1 Tax=Pedobacter hiemivivus TaxID=2530454 RepID=A0A4R0NDM9_9SPHI|nr:hypothetical protein [Pedobacter hiemivivus]TCC97182.1 hypothetical protein EZ444_10050 [Pedobacter hiemivivus]